MNKAGSGPSASLQANGSAQAPPDDRLREAIHGAASEYAEQWIASSQVLLAMTEDNKQKGAHEGRL
jgi:hypothetical protein